MDEIQEIACLISIKQYVTNMAGSFSIDKKELKDLHTIELLLDKKVVALLLGQKFKDYVNFEQAEAAKAEARRLNTQVFSAIK